MSIVTTIKFLLCVAATIKAILSTKYIPRNVDLKVNLI